MSEASKPKVGFVVPAYNAAGTIAGTLDSIFAQDWPRDLMEIVVVDNGSADGTPEIVRRYPVKLEFERKRGRSAPRNRGIAAASPETTLIASVDADVEIPSDFLKTLVSAMDRPWIGAAQAAVARIRKEGREEPSREYKLAHYYMPFLDTCAVVFRREAFDAAHGFDEELARNIDMDFSFRLLACGYAFAWVPDAVVEKHHELSGKQAFRRGCEAGKASYQLNAKWRRRIHRSEAGLALDRVRGWTLPLVRRLLKREPGAMVLAAETAGRVVSWTWYRLAGSPTTRGSFAPATRLPEVLGPERYLLLHGATCSIYDGPTRRKVCLSEEDTATIRELVDNGGDAMGLALAYHLKLGR
jgi:glycosyltransferase involved in cell wall biosynthesis